MGIKSRRKYVEGTMEGVSAEEFNKHITDYGLDKLEREDKENSIVITTKRKATIGMITYNASDGRAMYYINRSMFI